MATPTQPTPEVAGTTAQRLVVRGYKDHLRRNYLIQIVNDDVDRIYASASQDLKKDFEQKRLKNWLEKGILPRAIFYELINCWISQGNLAAGISPEKNDGKCQNASPSFFVDVGITFDGFEQLGAHQQLTDLFGKKAPAFRQGAVLRAAEKLGDSGASAPEHWCSRYQKGNTHVVLVVHALPPTVCTTVNPHFLAFENCIYGKFAGHPVATLMRSDWIEESTFLADKREVHFGYIDGLSSPKFKGIHPKKAVEDEPVFNRHQAGELLLGYPRNDGSNAWKVPGALYQEHRPSPLKRLPATSAYGRFFQDGSFGVLRKIYQNTPEFEKYLHTEAQRVQGARSLAYTVGWLKAKILGRWPNGERVEEIIETTDSRQMKPAQSSRISPSYDSAKISAETDRLGYKADIGAGRAVGGDPDGFRCPFGAHVRRMNPRDDPVVPKLSRPLLRRGLPYGPKYEADKGKFANDGEARGLLGLFFCASIEDQFEHVLGNWANNNPMGMPFKKHGKDPLIGNQDVLGGQFEIPIRNDHSIWLKNMPTFVETRGTCYAFFPSTLALKDMADGLIGTATLFLETDG